MSFIKKLGNTAKNTASSIGTKSSELMETGKLKLERSQLEGKIKNKKTEIGDLVYAGYKQQQEPDNQVLQKILEEIKELENSIAEIKSKLEE